MVQGLESDLKQLVLNPGPFGPQEIRRIEQAIAEDFSQFRALRDAVGDSTPREIRAPRPRCGWAFAIPAGPYTSPETLKSGDGGALANFYLGKANVALGNSAPTQQYYTAAAKAGYNADECDLARAEALRLAATPAVPWWCWTG